MRTGTRWSGLGSLGFARLPVAHALVILAVVVGRLRQEFARIGQCAEANQLMQPSTAASSIGVDTGPSGGSCQHADARTNRPRLDHRSVAYLARSLRSREAQ